MKYSNWSKSVKFNPNQVLHPSSIEEVQSIVKDAYENNKTVRVVGSGHSFTPLIETNNVLLTLDNLQGIVAIDKENKQAEVFAGTKLHILGPELFKNDLAQENMGDINVQSIAGALSTGTHGTGETLGTLSTQMLAVTLVNGKGELITLTKGVDANFNFAQVALGSLGIMVKVKLQLVSKYKLKYNLSKIDYNEVLGKIDDLVTNNRNVEFYFFPYTDTCQLKVLNISDEKIKSGGIGKKFNDIVMENGVFYIVNKISTWFKAHKAMAKLSAWGAGKGEFVNWSHEIYATKRYVKFNEMEYNIPKKNFKEALQEIKTMIVKENVPVSFPIECRFVKSDDIPLSPAYQRESAYIAVHMYKTRKYADYFKKVEAIMAKYNGRPHWGKRHFLTATDFKNRYPKWDDFHALRKRMDPQGVFMNDYLHSIFE